MWNRVAVARSGVQTRRMSESEVVDGVLRAYGLTGATVTPLHVHGSTSVSLVRLADGVERMLKRTPAVDGTQLRLIEQAELIQQLSERGVPVARPLLAVDGQAAVHTDDAAFALTSRLVPRAPGLPDRAEVWATVGGQLATLHTALEQCPATTHGWTMELPRQLTEEIWPALDTVIDVIGPLLPAAADRTELSDRLAGLPIQRLHGDTHGGNILLDRLGIYGIVDFDEIPIGPRVNDVGYYAADLVKNRLDLSGNLLEIISEVVSGYHRVAALSSREVEALVPLMIVTELRLLWWWFHTSGNDPAHLETHLDTLAWILDHRAELDAAILPLGAGGGVDG